MKMLFLNDHGTVSSRIILRLADLKALASLYNLHQKNAARRGQYQRRRASASIGNELHEVSLYKLNHAA
jgi:hypothetical protein